MHLICWSCTTCKTYLDWLTGPHRRDLHYFARPDVPCFRCFCDMTATGVRSQRQERGFIRENEPRNALPI